jgi:hypothetical protein
MHIEVGILSAYEIAAANHARITSSTRSRRTFACVHHNGINTIKAHPGRPASNGKMRYSVVAYSSLIAALIGFGPQCLRLSCRYAHIPRYASP